MITSVTLASGLILHVRAILNASRSYSSELMKNRANAVNKLDVRGPCFMMTKRKMQLNLRINVYCVKLSNSILCEKFEK